MAALEQIHFTGAGVTLAASTAGPADGMPVLFLHGGGQTRHSWGRAVGEAAQRGYRAITLDLRGHGDSEWSPGGNYSLEVFADDVARVVTAIGRPPVIVGASLGGLAGMLVSARDPAPTAALILVDVAARMERAGTAEIGNFMGSAPNGFASLDEAADAVAAYLPHRERPRDHSGLMRNLRRQPDGRLRWHWDPAFMTLTPKTITDPHMLDNAAAALRVPTLLIRGGRSKVVSAATVAHFRSVVPHAEFVDVAGADHMVAGDANDAFNTAVFDFLGRHVTADGVVA